MESAFKLYSLGYVSEDKKPDSLYVNIYPMEYLPNATGELNKSESTTTTTVNIHGENVNVTLNKSNVITAKWLKYDSSNRITPPDVCKGELVVLYTYAGTDRYYWTPMFAEPDLRKQEKVVYFYSNKKSLDNNNFIDKGYSLIVDTINKFIRLFTSKNDGEYTTYEMYLDTKEGNFTLEDDLLNKIVLDSKKDAFITDTNKLGRFNTPLFIIAKKANSSYRLHSDEDYFKTVSRIIANIKAHVGVEVVTPKFTISDSAGNTRMSCTLNNFSLSSMGQATITSQGSVDVSSGGPVTLTAGGGLVLKGSSVAITNGADNMAAMLGEMSDIFLADPAISTVSKEKLELIKDRFNAFVDS